MTNKELKTLCAEVEIYVQNNISYRECIRTGHIAERFDVLLKKLSQEKQEKKSPEEILDKYLDATDCNINKELIVRAMIEFNNQ